MKTNLVFVFAWRRGQAAVTEEDKEQVIVGLQKKVAFLEGWLHKNLSQDENLQELLKEVSKEPTRRVIPRS